MKKNYKKLKIEDINYLSQFEEHFRMIEQSNYCRNIPSHKRRKLLMIYLELGYEHSGNINCSECVYSLLEKLGKLYFTALERLKKKENDRERKEIND